MSKAYSAHNTRQRLTARRGAALLLAAFVMLLLPARGRALNIQLDSNSSLTSHADATDAFHRAADQWERRLGDPIDVTIEADFASLGSNTIGASRTVQLFADNFDVIRDQMVVDASDESSNGIVSALPTGSNFSASLPPNFSLELGSDNKPDLQGTKANIKALGFTGLDQQFGAQDAQITFNSDFDFDFDNRDGVDAGKTDFETVAAHEIGHALGWVSAVDVVDQRMDNNNPGPVRPRIMDLFRFEDATAGDPATQSEFTSADRFLEPGGTAVFDDLDAERLLSTGVFNGDGRQASHFKDNNLTGNLLGMMDPTLASGQTFPLTSDDLRVLDVGGYELIPTPAAGLGGGALLAMLLVGRRGRASRRR